MEQIIVVDDELESISGSLTRLKKILDDKKFKLVVCTSSEDSVSGHERAKNALGMFNVTLSNMQFPDTIIGIVLDVNMPVENLGEFGQVLESAKTGNGSYTGFQVARYILSNDEGISPFGSTFSNIPIAFNTLYGFQHDSYTEWMGSDYSMLRNSTTSKYTHLYKGDPTQLTEWVQLCLAKSGEG